MPNCCAGRILPTSSLLDRGAAFLIPHPFSYAADKEEELADYNARRANVTATEKALWNEELALHSLNVAEAEQGVYRQRVIDWMFRADPTGYAGVMQTLAFPFRVNTNQKLA